MMHGNSSRIRRHRLITALVSATLLVGSAYVIPASAKTMMATSNADVIAKKPVLIGIGDSYTAGVGAPFDIVSGQCRRSALSYPLVAAKRLGYEGHDYACSGARTDAISRPYLGEVAQVTNIRNADYIAITIGGNDANALQTLSTSPLTLLSSSFAVDFHYANVAPMAPRLASAYAAVRVAAPRAKVFVVGYPDPFPSTANGLNSCTGLPGWALTYIPAALLNGPLAQMHQVVTDINATVRSEATRAGFTYVDVQRPFNAHDICSADPWVWGMNAAEVPDRMHPTTDGYNSMASSLQAAIIRSNATTAIRNAQPPVMTPRIASRPTPLTGN